MERNLADLLPIYGVDEGCILSKKGDYTIGFRLTKPEIFTLSAEQYESLHQSYVKAMRVLPPHTILHQQDWFLTDRYTADFKDDEKSFLAHSSERFFNESPWLRQESYLFLTRRPKGRQESTSAFSSLLRGSLLPADAIDPRTVQAFKDQVAQFIRILEDGGLINAEWMDTADLWSGPQRAGLIESYCTLSRENQPVLRDIEWKPELQIGDRHCLLFTLADADDLPGLCGPRIDYAPYCTDRTRYSIGFASALGPLLPCDHIYNQYIFLDDQAAVLKKLEAKRLRLQSLAAYSRENAVSEEATNAFLNEAVEEQRLPVRAHFNILAWTENPAEKGDIRNRIGSAIAQLEATPRLETVGAPQIWWAGLPGNEGDFPMNETFRTFGEVATCFLNQEANYRSSHSPFGLRLGDRLTGRPVHVDIDDEPRREGLIANGNMFVLSGSGGGKSFFMNHLVREYYDRGTHIVLVDVGHSYEIQCALHGGYYFTYREDDPICFNPFYIGAGDVLDTEKRESIKTLLLALWKKSSEGHNRAEYVALSNALQGYFEKIARERTIFPCFDSFYEYLKDEFTVVLAADGVKDKDFDLANFLYVLRPFYKGGEFDYLLNARANLDLLQERFIVFELDNIKSHPILFPVVTLIIMELFVGKMRKLKGVRKMIVVEEAWKAIAQEGMAEYIKFLFKTARKFFAKAVVVTQEVEDIVSSEIIRQAIVNNSDIKVLLDQSKFQNKFDEIQTLLGITEKQKAEILSINKGHEPGRLYKDLWIGLGAMHSKVYRLEVSEQEYYTYTSEQRDKVLVRQYIDRYGDVKTAISRLVADLQAKKEGL
ncbi:TraG family conjugative transposon ATPase [Puia dinghuensis]|uniref:Transposase n=1 Tax=Puia dinghuensis TaxID=1792502 RepID=A0A8J2UHU3_9BACT|nr:TraG family conjugative transposon ATPase [Puia dinghuensis]GGB20097.1 transposase [Puia dinghuensis]